MRMRSPQKKNPLPRALHKKIDHVVIGSETPLYHYLSFEKSFYVEYWTIKGLLKSLTQQGFPKLSEDQQDTFLKLYSSLSQQIKKIPLYEYLNYGIWNDQSIPIGVRQKTKFFQIISNWIVQYEMSIGKLEGIKDQVKFIRKFLNKEATTMFQNIVVFAEIYDDLVELFEPVFWVNQPLENQSQRSAKQYTILKQDLEQLIKFLSELVYHHTIFIEGHGPYMNSILSQILPFSGNYKNFILNSLQFILRSPQLNDSQQQQRSILENPEQTELTRISLTFLQRPDLSTQQIISLISLLMVHTCKAVRFAMIVDYVKFYDYLEKNGNEQVLEALEEIIYFRELIIGRNQIDEAGLIVHTLGTALKQVNVTARSRSREYGEYSILQIEVLIDAGDISLLLWKVEQGKERQFWKQQKTEDRRIDILLKQEGLYCLEFNNVYSWIKGKKIRYKIEQYGYFKVQE